MPKKDTQSQYAGDYYPGNKQEDKGYSNTIYSTPIKKKPKKVYHDELKDKLIAAPKLLKDLTKDNWIKIPVQQTKREKRTYGQNWGYKSYTRYDLNPVSPRIMWFKLDWSLAECHKQIVSKYLYMLRDLNQETPKYEDVFGLTQDDPTAMLREEHLDLELTNVPFMVNIVNPYKEKWGYNPKCRICGNDSDKCENCKLPFVHNMTLRDLLQHTCHKTKFEMNDYLFGQNQGQAMGKWDSDSEDEDKGIK